MISTFSKYFSIEKNLPPLPIFGFKCLHLSRNGQILFTVIIYPKILYFLLRYSKVKWVIVYIFGFKCLHFYPFFVVFLIFVFLFFLVFRFLPPYVKASGSNPIACFISFTLSFINFSIFTSGNLSLGIFSFK